MDYVFYRKPFGKSARKLAAAMGLQAKRSPNAVPDAEGSVAWGGATAFGALNGDIVRAKRYQMEMWRDAGLLTVPFTTVIGVDPQYSIDRSGSGYGGSDFSGERFRVDYSTKPVPSTNEYRLHVFRYKGGETPRSFMVARVGWKVNEDPSLNKVVQGVPIRSRQYGWRIHYYSDANTVRWIEGHEKAALAARWAVSTIGWDFGAVDMLKGTDGKWYLLEANSAPGLSDDATLQCYARRLEAIRGR